MTDGRDDAGLRRIAATPHRSTDPVSTAGQERILLLECRLAQRQSQLESARAEADLARTRLADAAAREADHARRYSAVVQELAEARAEIASLHRRLEHSEALRAQLEGQLFEPGAREDAEELVRLRREILVERHRAELNERTAERLRERIEELQTSRETILSHLAEWQELVRQDDVEAVDLARYMSDLRREILDLESRNTLAERREAAYRRRLAMAGVDPDEVLAEVPEAAASPARPADAAADGEAESAQQPVLRLDELPLFELPLEPITAGARDDDEPADDGVAEDDSEPADDAVTAYHSEPEDDVVTEADGGPAEDVVTAEDLVPADPAVARLQAGVSPAVMDPAVDREAYADIDAVASREDDGADDAADPEHDAEADPAADEPRADVDIEPAATLEPSVEPDAAPGAMHALVAALESADVGTLRTELRRCIQVCGEEAVLDAIRPWTESERTAVRAAAYEALGLLLGRNAAALEPFMRAGLGDPDGRVRRRVVLAAAAAQGLPLRSLLEPVRVDRDPQVRRVVMEVLRHAPPAADDGRRPADGLGVLSAVRPVA